MDLMNSKDCRLRAEELEFLSRVLSLIVDREMSATLARSWRLREIAAMAFEAKRPALGRS